MIRHPLGLAAVPETPETPRTRPFSGNVVIGLPGRNAPDDGGMRASLIAATVFLAGAVIGGFIGYLTGMDAHYSTEDPGCCR